MSEIDPGLLNYIRILEDGIILCDEVADNDPAYSLRIIACLANRIRANAERAQEAEAEREALQTRH
jgi:hypothetical protein